MSEVESFSVRVGGAITGEQLSTLLRLAEWENAEYVTEETSLEDLDREISLIVYTTPLEIRPTVESFLITNNLQFDLDCHSSDNYNGTTSMYRPATEDRNEIYVSFVTDIDSEIVIRKSDLVDIIARAMATESPVENWDSLLHELDVAIGANIPELELPYISSGILQVI